MSELGSAKARVYGISTDTFFALKAFQDQQKLTFPLLSDYNKEVIRDYGVFNEDMIGLKGIAKRAVFVIDKDGVVRHREVLEDARNEPNYQQVFDSLTPVSENRSFGDGPALSVAQPAPVQPSAAAPAQ